MAAIFSEVKCHTGCLKIIVQCSELKNLKYKDSPAGISRESPKDERNISEHSNLE